MDSSIPSTKSSNRQKHLRSKHKKDYHSSKKHEGKIADKKRQNSSNNDIEKKEIIINKNNNNIVDEISDSSDDDIDNLIQSPLCYKDSLKQFSKKSLNQPESRFADIIDDPKDDDTSKSFETLLTMPISTGHFVFKSEKNWTVDTSKYSNYFTADVKKLSTIINCLPFNEYININDKYFTKDQLSMFQSTAEHNKKNYEEELTNSTDLNEKLNIPDIEEDLDFLLSLKEPVLKLPTNIPTQQLKKSEEKKSTTTSNTGKSIDLEKWLDSVLAD